MGSRFVITEKNEDGEATRMKARWCLQGHLDPDVLDKVKSGSCQSPTLSQLGRMLLFQLIVSHKWTMALGDIKGAFMEAGPLADKYKPLYARLPAGGIPGVSADAIIEVLGNVYGQNDAPHNWYVVFDQAVRDAGFVRSRFDPCLYYTRENGKLTGVLGAHVDDTATGGTGATHNKAIAFLKQRFPYRKWRIGNGDFCGSIYNQCPKTFEITMSQSTYAESLKPISMSRTRQNQKEAAATDGEVGTLRAVNGAVNWLAGQSRPDLSIQVSKSQQCFPRPTVQDLHNANLMIRRARQHADCEVTFRYIPPDKLTTCTHTDAAYANATEHKTQAGNLIGFTHVKLNDGFEAN